MKTFGFNTWLAGIGSTFALVVWGMIFWGWVHELFGVFNKLPGDTEVVELLIANGTTTGTYFFPWPRNTPETFADFVQQHKIGPFFQLSYIKEGVDPQAPAKILRGVLQYFIVSMIAVALVRLTITASTSFWRKFSVVFLAGLMGTLFIRLSDRFGFIYPGPTPLEMLFSKLSRGC